MRLARADDPRVRLRESQQLARVLVLLERLHDCLEELVLHLISFGHIILPSSTGERPYARKRPVGPCWALKRAATEPPPTLCVIRWTAWVLCFPSSIVGFPSGWWTLFGGAVAELVVATVAPLGAQLEVDRDRDRVGHGERPFESGALLIAWRRWLRAIPDWWVVPSPGHSRPAEMWKVVGGSGDCHLSRSRFWVGHADPPTVRVFTFPVICSRVLKTRLSFGWSAVLGC